MMREATVAVCLLAALPARAQTQADVNACYGDAMRLCRAQTQGAFAAPRTLHCMLDHRTQLSTRCGAVFAAHGM